MDFQLPENAGESERLRAAIDWLARQSQPHDISQINEASQRFILSPLAEDSLIQIFIQPNRLQRKH